MTTKNLFVLLGILIIIGALAIGSQSFLQRLSSDTLYTTTPTQPAFPNGNSNANANSNGSAVINPATPATACTMEAKLCPDGSYVGRSGPSCNFALCPSPAGAKPAATTPIQKTYTIAMGGSAGGYDFHFQLFGPVNDSRCPVDVRCIQAGTVKVNAHVFLDGTEEDHTFALNTPQTIGSTTVTLYQVAPVPHAGKTLVPSDYQFTFYFVQK